MKYQIKKYQYNDLDYLVKYDGDHLLIELDKIGYIEGYNMSIDLDISSDLSESEIDSLGINDPYYSIKYIQVYDNYKNKGYGNELMSVFLDITKKLKISQIILNACPIPSISNGSLDLKQLILFYESWGFEVIKKYKSHAIMMLEQ